MDLLQSLFSNLWSAFLVVLFFGGSIFVHELGHFLAARRRGVHVERFSIGFGPKIFSWRGKDGVEYRLSWLPLGGYVALPQLADMRAIEGESSAEVAKLPPITYATKVIVFVAGAVFNVIFAFLLACIVWFVGQPTTTVMNTTQIGAIQPTIELSDGTKVPSPASEAKLQPGDIIRAIDGKPVDNWLNLLQTLAASSGRTTDGRREARLTIERSGETVEITVHPRLTGDEGYRTIGISPADDMGVDEVIPGSPAAVAGIKAGDSLVSVDGQALYERGFLGDYFQKTAGRGVTLGVKRGPETLQIPISPRLEKTEAGKDVFRIGIKYREVFFTLYPTPLKQISDHATMTYRVLSGLLNPKSDLGPSKLSGPVGIARGFHSLAQVDIRLVLWFAILVNVNLAIFNLLPIPVLDGGHILFATIGKLRGRALPGDFVATTQSVFMVLLFSMIVYVSYRDVIRLMRDNRPEKPAATSPAPKNEQPAPTLPEAAPVATPATP